MPDQLPTLTGDSGVGIEATPVVMFDQNGNPLSNTLGSGEAHIGQVGGTTRIVTAGLNRPADTTAYAVGDLIGATTAAGAGNVLTLSNAARINGGSGRLIRLRGATNDATCVATIRVHFMKMTATPTVGDNAPIRNSIANYIFGYGYADLQFSAGDVANNIFSDGAKDYQAFVPAIAFDVDAGATAVYALLEARTTFTPKSGQRFSISLEVDQD